MEDRALSEIIKVDMRVNACEMQLKQVGKEVDAFKERPHAKLQQQQIQQQVVHQSGTDLTGVESELKRIEVSNNSRESFADI